MSKLPLSTPLSLAFFLAACGSGSGSSPADGGPLAEAGSPSDGPSGSSDAALADGSAASDTATTDAAPASDSAAADSAPSMADGGAGDVNLMSGFVRATVAGQVLDYRALVGATEGALAGGPYLQIGGHKELTGRDYWAVTVANAVGTYSCNDSMHPFTGVGLARSESGPIPNMYAASKGSCTITLTAAAPKVGDVAKGTFSAKIVSLYDASQMLDVTDGAFEAPRSQ